MVEPLPSLVLSEIPDEELLALTVAQDVDAFEALYDRHAKTVYSLILRIVHAPEIAEELGVPLGTVLSRMRAAMMKLEKSLERHFDE